MLEISKVRAVWCGAVQCSALAAAGSACDVSVWECGQCLVESGLCPVHCGNVCVRGPLNIFVGDGCSRKKTVGTADNNMITRGYKFGCPSVAMARTRQCVILLFAVLCVRGAACDILQCEERHIVNNMNLDGLYNSEVCTRASEGQSLKSSDCIVWDFAEGVDDYNDCRNLTFSSSSGDALSGIQVYPYTAGERSNLNITFKDVNWRYMQYRQRIDKTVSCQKLQVSESLHIQPALQLSFACNVWGYWSRGLEVELLLNVGESPSHMTAHAHLLLRMPESVERVDPLKASVTNWTILVAVDVAQKPHLRVHWPAVPARFGVTEYRVQLGDSVPKVVDISLCDAGYCSLDLFAGYASREVSVSVQPIHAQCGDISCRSFSPGFRLEFSFPMHFILLIAAAFVLCLLIIVCSIYFFCCALPREPPTLLILYDATELQHCRVVRILAEYLKDTAHIRCWLADEQVPLTESKNPSKWLHKAFDEADAVLIVASPSMHPDIRYSVYPNIQLEAVSLIAGRKQCSEHNESCGRYLVAIPPYCCVEDIPKGMEDLPRLLLPRHLPFLVWSVYNQRSWWPPLSCMVRTYLLACWCPGPTSAYKTQGSRLADALRVAGAAQTIVVQAPPTPRSSIYTGWTLRNSQQDQKGDSISMPYGEFPGDLNSFPLLLGGSIATEESTAAKVTVDLNNLSL